MNRFLQLISLAAVVALSGCVTNYQYTAAGQVTTTSGETRDAVMFWHGDEGRLWYGKKYRQTDTDINVRVCQATPKIFSLRGGYYVLPGRDGDLRVVGMNDDGTLFRLDRPEPVGEGGTCGVISLSGKPAEVGEIGEGERPVMNIVCGSESRPGRYPRVNKYVFEPVVKTETDEDRTAPDACRSR